MLVPLRFAILLLLGVIAACAGRARVLAPGQQGIGEVKLAGELTIDRDELLGGLGLVFARETGQPFGRFLVAQDARRIESYYVRRGYFAATVENTVERKDTRTDVTFTIVEGPRAKLVRVEIDGLPEGAEVSASDLRALIPIDDGDDFDHELYDEAQPLLPKKLQDAGYAHAKVEGVVLADRGRAEAVIRVRVELGPLVRFGKVSLVGVPPGLREAVDARVVVREGDRYSPDAMEETRAALYEPGRFALVRVEPQLAAGSPTADVTITVAEAALHDLRLGGGVGLNPIAFEVRTRARYAVAGWPAPLASARAELQPAIVIQRDDREVQPRVDASVGLDRLDLVRPRYTGAVEASFSYLAVEGYTSYGPRLRLSARSPTYLRTVQASIGWQLGWLAYRDVSPVIDPALEHELGLDRVDRIGAYDQSVVVDLRDDRVTTRRGGYFELRLEEGTVGAGGELTYLRVMPDLRGYYTLGPITLAARARLGALTGDVPVTRRFFGGGANGYRGLPERQLAPFAQGVVDGDTVRVPYGGTALLDLSTELRFPLATIYELDFGGDLFVDGGDVTEGWGALDLGHLHWAAGAGLRVLTVVGAVRLDVAYRLDRFGSGEPRVGDRFAFHLSVGEAF